MDLDLEELAAVMELLAGADFTEFRLTKGDLDLVVTRGVAASAAPVLPSATHTPAPQPVVMPAAAPVPAAAPPVAATPASSGPHVLAASEVFVTAPMLGSFYRSPKPGEPPFLEVGDKVEIGAVVGILEVMKLMSSVTSDVEGEVIRVLADDGELVEVGQPLFVVRTIR
ncbi:MAG: acetyl-CoA carboxylase biotin carboxyl carrier protein [Actinophytocola sp.]|nr:acetyl-CoA carboxylase biotin carboxyl carrier protein [Actinophytocola sp.]